MEILKSVCTTICCTRLWQAETLDNTVEIIKCDEKIHHDKLEDLPKAIFTTDENLTKLEHQDKDVVKFIIALNKYAPNICNEVCEENSKTKSSNASTSISEKFCSHNARFAEQHKCIRKQNSKKDEKWKMVIITDNYDYLSNLDEPQRYDALKSIPSEIDIQDLFKLSSRAESTRLPVPQSVVTDFTENCKCRTTSTAYISRQEDTEKVKRNRRPCVTLRKRIFRTFRRCFHKNVL